MASKQDQAELKRLVAKLVPAAPQSSNLSPPSSGLGQAIVAIASAADELARGREYYAVENKSQSRKIGQLQARASQLQDQTSQLQDRIDQLLNHDEGYFANQNKYLIQKIDKLIAESGQLKVENARLKDGSGQASAYGDPYGGPSMSNPGGEWERMMELMTQMAQAAATVRATSAATITPAAPGYDFPTTYATTQNARPFGSDWVHPDRQRIMMPQGHPNKTTASDTSVNKVAGMKSSVEVQRFAQPTPAPEPVSDPAVSTALVAGLKRKYSDEDSAPTTKTPRLDYGNPIVKQALKAAVGSSGGSKPPRANPDEIVTEVVGTPVEGTQLKTEDVDEIL